MSRPLVGLIVENTSDAVVIEAILTRLAPNRVRGFRRRLAGGCGAIARKCGAWADELAACGCSILIVARDADELCPISLQSELSRQLRSCKLAKRLVLIPVQEIEAWLLSDVDAIRSALNLKKPIKQVMSPEKIHDPKEHISKLVWAASEKTKYFVNTIHNEPIAKRVRLANMRRCPSFLPLETLFLRPPRVRRK